MAFVVDLHYLPAIPWMALAWRADVLYLEACEHFQKGSYRNRCHIAGPNGMQRLSVPLQKGKHQQTPIREVRTARDVPWRQVHWRSIQTAYGNAPFFEFYADGLEAIYRKSQPFLFDFNLELLCFLLKKLGWNGDLRLTERFQPKLTTNVLDRGLEPDDYRNSVMPAQAPPWFVPLPYPQVFSERYGFLSALSALDLLFCQGKNAGGQLLLSTANLCPE